jgi:diguanylate cyclase (GGDEF)-like protein
MDSSDSVSLRDPLTGLPGRALLADRLRQALALSDRTGERTAVAYARVDQLEEIAAQHGGDVADELRQAVALRLVQHLRGGDTVACEASDAFVFVWPGVTTAEEARSLAQRVAGLLRDPFTFGIQPGVVKLSASIGVAVSTPGEASESLLESAHGALADATGSGGGQLRLSDRTQPAGQRDSSAYPLNTALDRGELALHYQPVVDVEGRVVTGVEALLRWQHPEGLRLPDSFIPQAEANGLILRIGAWVIEEACRQGTQWRSSGLELDVAVNLSARQVCHPDVVNTIAGALQRTGFPAGRLLIEITETTMMEDAEIAYARLSELAALGIRIAIDDFGTGYSSLLYLKRYPISVLKIDRSFIAGLGHNRSDDAIVASVVTLARAYGAACIAEGVETRDQLARLRSLQCTHAQGNLFGVPVPADALAATLSAYEAMMAAPVSLQPVTGMDNEPVAPAVLARIEQLHEEGASPFTIAAALNRERAPHPRNIRWHGTAVTRELVELLTAS